MGLAASQARLLSITQRISDNELRAQLINNQKMRLNSESSRVSENYINALNKTNLVFANYDSEDNAQNVPLTFNNLTAFNQYNNQYNLTNAAGNVLISEDVADKYIRSGGKLEQFLAEYDISYTTSYWDTISDQLHKCEAFYSNPNQNNFVDNPTWDSVKNLWTSEADGDYSFYNAEELKEMYEGKNVASYAETIKTGNYTDFIKAYDLWNETIASYRKQTKTLNALLEKASNEIMTSMGTPVNASEINVDNTGNITSSKTIDFSGFFVSNATVAVQDYLPTLEGLGFTKNGTTYTKPQDWEQILGANITNISSSALTHNALYLNYNGNTYVQIHKQEQDEHNNTISYWLNTADNQIYSYTTGGTDLVVTVFPVTSDIKNEDESETIGTLSSRIIPTYDATNRIATWTIESTETYTNGNTSGTSSNFYFAQYPDPSSGSTNCDLTLDLTKTASRDIVKNLTADYINNNIDKMLKDIQASGNKFKGLTTLTAEEIETLNTPISIGPQLDNLLNQLKVLLFDSNEDGKFDNTDRNYASLNGLDQEAMDEVLMLLTSGTNFTPYGDGYRLILGNGDPVDIPKERLALINALICDTMMDYFGEPIYGYMKQNSSGEWVTANEEAKWYMHLFEKIQSCGYQVLAKGLANSTDWMQFALENGIVVMEQINTEENWQPITHTSCSDIIEQTDSQAATIAEAEYNKAMRQIEAKDEMFDLELKNIDTEHTSLQSEYESVKKAMTGNIERTFQMYG